MRIFRYSVCLVAVALTLALPVGAQEARRVRPVLWQPGDPVPPPAKPAPPKAEVETLPLLQDEGSPIVKCPSPELVKEAISTLKSRITTTKPSAGTLPKDCDESHPYAEPIHVGMGGDRGWGSTQYDWVPPGLQHRPLYFEDDPLERYGQTRHPLVQPFASYGRFFAQIPMIPYRAALEEPRRTICTLGYERPGNCVRPVRQLPPWSRRAALVEGAAVAGLILLVP